MTETGVYALKKAQLSALAEERASLYTKPDLRWLFFELTDACNLFCAHCGSRCTGTGSFLAEEDVLKVLDTIPDRRPLICLTGGEPLLHPDFFRIARQISDRGFHWGMTTNGTCIDRETAVRIREARMDTVSVSLDGLEPTHDALRGKKGAWRRAIDGIRHLQDSGYSPQVTTVVHPGNIGELDTLFDFLCGLGIRSWRPINVEPIGRVCESRGLLLNATQMAQLLAFIQRKRYDPSCPMEVTYGCSHYLGVQMERTVRSHYFFCGAGTLIASVRSNGDICACLDIENLPELVQGNIRKDDFWEVWCRRFRPFRTDRTAGSAVCADCGDRLLCCGDSAHTWDWKSREPALCLKQMFSGCESGCRTV